MVGVEVRFSQTVVKWCQAWVAPAALAERIPSLSKKGLDRLRVQTGRLTTSWMPWADERTVRTWYWRPIAREIDVSIGLEVELATARGSKSASTELVPLIVIELKTGGFNTDVLDKKSAIYGAPVETYPWVHRVFLHENAPHRAASFYRRNLRHFDSVFVEWKAGTRRLLGRQIDHQLEYLIGYWGL